MNTTTLTQKTVVEALKGIGWRVRRIGTHRQNYNVYWMVNDIEDDEAQVYPDFIEIGSGCMSATVWFQDIKEIEAEDNEVRLGTGLTNIWIA